MRSTCDVVLRRLHTSWKRLQYHTGQIGVRTGSVDINPHQLTVLVEVQDDTLGNLLTLNARFVEKVDVK